MLRIYMNVSGSGKTRVIFEGLCKNWGFYLTCKITGGNFGSDDVSETAKYVEEKINTSTAADVDDEGHRRRLVDNGKIAQSAARVLLLVRFEMLYRFLKRAEIKYGGSAILDPADSLKLKTLWLRAQLYRNLDPLFLKDGPDHFTTLTVFARRYDDALVRTRLSSLIGMVRRLVAGPDQGASSNIYCVLDEAQEAGAMSPGQFKSTSSLELKTRPLLGPLVSGWLDKSLESAFSELSIIISGTGLETSHLETLELSGLGKHDDKAFIRETRTGAFGDGDGQSKYVKQFFPRNYLDTAAGRDLLFRLHRWLSGRFALHRHFMNVQLLIYDRRHRTTARYIEEVLINGLISPHQILDRFINVFACCVPTDNPYSATEEHVSEMSVRKEHTFHVLFRGVCGLNGAQYR